MTTASQGFALEVVWLDNDMLELKARASNARFSGSTTFYAPLNEALTFASFISGFPAAANDTREYEFGGTDLPGYGGAKVLMACKDRSGHLFIHVSIYATSLDRKLGIESSTLYFETVPSAIDSFVDSLRRMQARVGEGAMLHAAT